VKRVYRVQVKRVYRLQVKREYRRGGRTGEAPERGEEGGRTGEEGIQEGGLRGEVPARWQSPLITYLVPCAFSNRYLQTLVPVLLALH
jgi:hypothetical protein